MFLVSSSKVNRAYLIAESAPLGGLLLHSDRDSAGTCANRRRKASAPRRTRRSIWLDLGMSAPHLAAEHHEVVGIVRPQWRRTCSRVHCSGCRDSGPSAAGVNVPTNQC